MSRAKWSVLIGMLSTFMYTSLTLFSIAYLIDLCGYIDPRESKYDSAVPQPNRTKRKIYFIICEFLAFVAMIVVSILLQVGVKRERPQLLTPWLFLSCVVTALGGIGLLLVESVSDIEFILNVILIVLQAAIWYPIYAHYKEMCQEERMHNGNCARHQNGAACYVGRNPNSVYATTTEFVNNNCSVTLPQQFN